MTTPRSDDPDMTQRNEVPADPGRAPVIRASGEPERYSPPAEGRPDWARQETTVPAQPTPERWYEPAATTPAAPVAAAPVTPTKSSRSGVGTVVGAALLSAVLASGGTVLALNATGVLDDSTPTGTRTTGTTVGANNQPVTIDESSATIAVASKASPAVVKINVNGSVDTSQGVIPPTRASGPASSSTPQAGS